MNTAALLEHTAAIMPDNRAVTHGERHLTYAQLWQAVDRLSRLIDEAGIPKGERIALLYENSVEYVACYFAIIRAGYVIVPLDTSAKPETLHSIIADCGPKLLVCSSRYARHLAKIVAQPTPITTVLLDKTLNLTLPEVTLSSFAETLGDPCSLPMSIPAEIAPKTQSMDPMSAPHELAAIYYTSGSTGAAKGVMLSHRNLVSNTLATVEYLRLTKDDSIMVILPFYYIYGNSLMLTHVACGGRMVIDNRFLYPEVILDTMEAEAVTGFSGVPSNFIILLGNSTFKQRKLTSLRYFTQAGGAMAPDIIRQLTEAFPSKETFIMYGQTEAAPRASWLPPERLREKLGSIGIAVPGVTLEVVDEEGKSLPVGKTGEIAVSGPNVMLGYWNQPEETAQVIKNGKLMTGDLARCDEDGYFFIVGRKKEIIKTGGNRVAAKEVEECLLRDTRILEVAVFGVPDDLLGEAIKAVVVLKDGQTVTPREIQEHCKSHLAPHKAPKHVAFLNAMPKLQSGKIDKQLLAKQPVGQV